MMRCGCVGFPAPKSHYFSALSFVELKDTQRALPNGKTLKRWRAETPEAFCFAMRAWQLITHPKDSPSYRGLPAGLVPEAAEIGHFSASQAVADAFVKTLSACENLGVAALVFDTPRSFTPTRENRARIAAFFEDAPRPEQTQFVWRPQGLWQAPEILSICSDLALLPSLDESILGVAEAAYVTLAHAHYTEDRLEQIADQLPPEGFVAFDCNDSYRLARALQGLLDEER